MEKEEIKQCKDLTKLRGMFFTTELVEIKSHLRKRKQEIKDRGLNESYTLKQLQEIIDKINMYIETEEKLEDKRSGD